MRSNALPFHNTNPRTHTKVSPDSWFPLSGCVCHTRTLLLAISDSSPIYIPSNQHTHPHSIQPTHPHTTLNSHTHPHTTLNHTPTHHTQFTPTHHTQVTHTHTTLNSHTNLLVLPLTKPTHHTLNLHTNTFIALAHPTVAPFRGSSRDFR